MTSDHYDEQQNSIAVALRHAQLTVDQLWMRYFALGGDCGVIDIDAYIHGLGGLAATQRDILAHAVNERLDELAPPQRAGYSDRVAVLRPSDDLSPVVKLLEGAELAPPDRLPRLLDTAAVALGVRITIHLIDHDAQLLYPWPADRSGQHREPLGVQDTLAGRAYSRVEVLASRDGDRPRLWLPLIDGVERLGVLEVEPDRPASLDAPGLRPQLRWLSILVGHLVTLLSQYGDAPERLRLPRPRTVADELVWSLLPPLTAGVDDFVVTGLLHSSRETSGDAFDYALSETTASMIVLAATGEGLNAALTVSAALTAYRNVRRAGHGLSTQARAVGEAVQQEFGNDSSVTALLAEIDLPTGRLRYLNAGQPPPLVMREDRRVEPLTDGVVPRLGAGIAESSVAEEVLEPHDWLVLHTHGVTGTLDPNGEPFGQTRLEDFLHREADAGNPPPETARRLVAAVHEHHGNRELREDATVVLARRTTPHEMVP